MFTGIIETTGTLRACDTHGDDSTLTIASQAFDFARCALGDSIAVNGICLTVTSFDAQGFSADVMPETVRRTSLAGLTHGTPLNLELIARFTAGYDFHIPREEQLFDLGDQKIPEAELRIIGKRMAARRQG